MFYKDNGKHVTFDDNQNKNCKRDCKCGCGGKSIKMIPRNEDSGELIYK